MPNPAQTKPCPSLPTQLISEILSRTRSRQTVLQASEVAKSWQNAIDFYTVEKVLPQSFLQSPTGVQLQKALKPLDILRYLERQNNNFIHGRYEEHVLEKPADSGKLIDMSFLDDGRLLRVFENYLYLTDLRSNTNSKKTIAQKFLRPISFFAKAQKGNRAILVLRQGQASIVDLANNLKTLITPNLPNPLYSASFSAEGNYLAILRAGGLDFWHFRQAQVCSLQLANVPNVSELDSVQFSPNNKHLVAVINGKLFIWNYNQNSPEPVAIDHTYLSRRYCLTGKMKFSASGNKLILETKEHKIFLINLTANIVTIEEFTVNPNDATRIDFHFFLNEYRYMFFDKVYLSLLIDDFNHVQNKQKQHRLGQPDNSYWCHNYYLSIPYWYRRYSLRTPCWSHLSTNNEHLIVFNSKTPILNVNDKNFKKSRIDVVNLCNQEKISNTCFEIPYEFSMDFLKENAFCFSGESDKIVFGIYDSKVGGQRQLLLDFSPKIDKL